MQYITNLDKEKLGIYKDKLITEEVILTDERLYEYESFIENTTRIIQAARENHVEVIYFQHDDGPGTGFSIGDEEFEIASLVEPMAGEKIFVKQINSCFGNKEFVSYLKEQNEDTLMMIGLQLANHFLLHLHIEYFYIF